MKKQVIICLSILILSLVVLKTGRTAANYTSQIQGSGSAEVAKFAVSIEEGEKKELVLDNANPSASYEFYVKNDGEVKISYDVIVSFPDNQEIPKGVTMSLEIDGVSGEKTATQGLINTNVYTFKDAGEVAYGTKGPKNTLKFVSTEESDEAITLLGIKVSVKAVQVMGGE